MEKFKLLSYDEESRLSIDEKKQYYYNLKLYLQNQPLQINELKNLTFCQSINKYLVRHIIDKIKGYDLIVNGVENIPRGPVIYASTHQDFNDHFNIVLSIPEHAIILNTVSVTKSFKFLMGFNGIVYVDRKKQQSRFDSKLSLMKYISLGKSVVVFPEGTYNCSPNKLHLPLHSGVIDIARKMDVPIVPVVQEYIYQPNMVANNNNVVSCQVQFGTPIYVSLEDDKERKKQELSEAFATIRYELIEAKGIYNRESINNQEYIDYVLGRINTWKKINVDINDERKTIYNERDDFYLFHHINDVAFDDNGNLLPTEHVLKLNKLYQKNINQF